MSLQKDLFHNQFSFTLLLFLYLRFPVQLFIAQETHTLVVRLEAGLQDGCADCLSINFGESVDRLFQGGRQGGLQQKWKPGGYTFICLRLARACARATCWHGGSCTGRAGLFT